MKVTVSRVMAWLTWATIWMCLALPCRAADDQSSNDPIVSPRYLEQPKIELKKPQIRWSPDLQNSWMQSLLLDEIDLKREASDALTLAQSLGMQALPEFRDVLWQIIDDDNTPVSCRVSAAQAYIAMGKPPANDELSAAVVRWPTALAIVLEPALAAWDSHLMRDIWLQRVQSDQADPALLRVAVEALGTVRDPASETALTALLQSSHQPFSLRMVAARSLSRLPGPHRVDLARAMLDAPLSAPMQWLLGVQLLGEEQSDEAIQLLERFADLDAPAVAGEALRQLLQVAPQKVIARAKQNIDDRDANIRAVTVDALITTGTLANIELLARALQDPVLTTRRTARDGLLQFASEEALTPEVVQKATTVLDSNDWRGIEQALILLTKLQQRDARQRLFQLLEHDRGEVMETAAWSIKELAQPDWSEQSLAALRKHLQNLTDAPTAAKLDALIHLVETMGVLRMPESLELLRTFVPKNSPFSPSVRGAAVWAIGEILQGQPNADVVSELQSRLNDNSPTLPESEIVRGMAAVSLGKMQSKASLQHLIRWRDSEQLNSFIGRRSAWAIFKITGDPIGKARTPTTNLRGWSVQPLK
ncbi:PBS lyase HEAT-like repeat protein [Roseimaritima multifibrata]|uniref:PBS lyase HEAT-like repeat protein n=1 Tax=Roseimaritima multifibrata TaxID=1930274 RepID=A0A517MC31_9BACT|nr:HEAT repeat domain-containing protein [Roseimaritima multifibrata]QDS92449.1 PBS lyase HEAT-like repeat protein [Roseimaritima multifibrata]